MHDKNNKTILLAEDEVIIAMKEQIELEKYGYNIVKAIDGERALQIFNDNHNIDLVLMDIDLGKGIDGTDAAALILKERDIPVVFLSSHSEPEIVDKTEKITSYGYILKNSSITVINASIKMAFKLFEANRIIKESERKLNSMIANISDVIMILNTDSIIKYVSPNIVNLMGWSQKELIGTSGFIRICPDDIEYIKKETSNLINEPNSPKMLEYRIISKDGKYKPVICTVTNLINDPNINGTLVNYHVVSDKEMELIFRERDRSKNIGII